MLRNEEVDEVRNAISMKNIASIYGLKVTRGDMACCPFHADKRPSMKLYDGNRGYFCFVCGTGGDVFDFVRKYESIGFEDAVRRVASMAGIPLSDGGRLTATELKAIQRRKTKREEAKLQRIAEKDRLSDLANTIHCYDAFQKHLEPLGNAWSAMQRLKEKAEMEWQDLFDQLYGKKYVG